MTREEAKVCIDAIIGTWEKCQNQKYLSAVDVEIDVEDIVALKMAITALSQEQQSEWERDHEVLKAYADGQESMKPCKDAISRQAAIDAIWDGVNMDIYTREVKECLEKLPSVSTEKIGRCKDCKYFEYDSVANVDGIPLILAHEVCSRWGGGCKTIENGYCFLYEPQESEEKE